MKYSVSNWIYGDEKLEKTLTRLSDLGYDGIEMKGEPEIYYEWKETKEKIDSYGLQTSSIAGIYPWPSERDLANPDPEMRRKAVDYVKKCVDFASCLEAPLVIVVPSSVAKTRPLVGREKEWKLAVDSVSDIARYAEDRGILIAVEPINRYETYLLNTAEQALRFIREVDSEPVKIMLDCFHMNIEESNPAGAIRISGENLIHLHIADSNRQSVGRGHTDFASIMKALKEIGYESYLAMEPLPPISDPYLAAKESPQNFDLYAKECIQHLREIERKI
jgi:sugar phosphate isomerase/epimerase